MDLSVQKASHRVSVLYFLTLFPTPCPSEPSANATTQADRPELTLFSISPLQPPSPESPSRLAPNTAKSPYLVPTPLCALCGAQHPERSAPHVTALQPPFHGASHPEPVQRPEDPYGVQTHPPLPSPSWSGLLLCTTPELLHKLLRLWLARLSMALSLSVPLSCSSVAPPPRAHHAGLTGPARCSSRTHHARPATWRGLRHCGRRWRSPRRSPRTLCVSQRAAHTGRLVVGRASLRGARGPQARSRASLLQHDEPIAEASPRPRVTLRCGPLAGPAEAGFSGGHILPRRLLLPLPPRMLPPRCFPKARALQIAGPRIPASGSLRGSRR